MVRQHDINMCVGTIFSILPAKNAVTQAEDFMQAGVNQAAAGYVLYGPSTMMATNCWCWRSILYF